MNRRVLVLFVILGLAAIVAGAGLYLLINVATGNKLTGTGGTPTPALTPSSTPPGASATSLPGHAGNGCGTKKNADGTYTFSWLHVSSDGKIVDESGCIVNLVGMNMGGFFLGDAGVGSDGITGAQRRIQWYKQNFPMNLVRIGFNSYWWDTNAFVPNANMGYRQWLQLYVKWQEQAGNYVELDKDTQFHEPPCGGPITFCPSQNQASKDYASNPSPANAQEKEDYIPPGVEAWTDLAKIYANDPAVIYDAWNEPTQKMVKDQGTFYQDMNTFINTIRSQNPRSLVIVFAHGYQDIASGHAPNFTQSNLVIDFHIYDGFNGVSPITNQQCSEPGNQQWTPTSSGFAQNVSYAQSHGQAVVINEWGGCYDIPAYHQQITSYAKARNIALAYFDAANVASTHGGGYQVNANGLLVRASYASILGANAG